MQVSEKVVEQPVATRLGDREMEVDVELDKDTWLAAGVDLDRT